MEDDNNGRIFGDMNSYIFDWLVAKPTHKPLAGGKEKDDEGKRINALMAMLSKESGPAGNVVPFKSRKK